MEQQKQLDVPALLAALQAGARDSTRQEIAGWIYQFIDHMGWANQPEGDGLRMFADGLRSLRR